MLLAHWLLLIQAVPTLDNGTTMTAAAWHIFATHASNFAAVPEYAALCPITPTCLLACCGIVTVSVDGHVGEEQWLTALQTEYCRMVQHTQ